MSEFRKDDEGNLINPPTLPEWEQKIAAAQNRGADAVELQQLQEDYNSAREDEVERLNELQRRREQQDDGQDQRTDADPNFTTPADNQDNSLSQSGFGDAPNPDQSQGSDWSQGENQ